jgi:aspartyl protease family protein
MAGLTGLAVLLVAAAILVATHGESQIAGLSPGDFAALASAGALALVIAGWVIGEFRGRWVDGLRAIVVWAILLVGLVAGYSYRFELQDVAARLVGEMAPGRAVVGADGGVVVNRRADGSFTVVGRIDEREARFIFDTGASMVVLTAETAAAAGIRPSPAEFTVPVFTANGATMAAATTLNRLTVGTIVERRVRALVARPGALRENLLGMTFLERLASYEVRGNRLTLRGRVSS